MVFAQDSQRGSGGVWTTAEIIALGSWLAFPVPRAWELWHRLQVTSGFDEENKAKQIHGEKEKKRKIFEVTDTVLHLLVLCPDSSLPGDEHSARRRKSFPEDAATFLFLQDFILRKEGEKS